MEEPDRKELEQRLATQEKRILKARREHNGLLAELGYLGSVGFIFVLPVVIGAYLGSWADDRYPTFQSSWTVTLIVLGVFIGAFNVYLFFKDRD